VYPKMPEIKKFDPNDRFCFKLNTVEGWALRNDLELCATQLLHTTYCSVWERRFLRCSGTSGLLKSLRTNMPRWYPFRVTSCCSCMSETMRS